MEGVTVKAGDFFDLGDGVKAKAPGLTGVAAHDCRCRCFAEYNMMTVEEFAKATGKTVEDVRKTLRKQGDSGIIKNIELPDDMVRGVEMPNDIKEEIKDTIEKVQLKYNAKVDEIIYKDISYQGKIPMQFNPVNKDGKFVSQFIVNSGYDWNSTLEEFNDRIYTKNHITKKLASKNTADLVCHEMAHFMTFQDCKSWNDFLWQEKEVREKFVEGISIYNDFSLDGAETIAEAFVAMQNGVSVPQEAVKLVEQYIMRWKK